MASRPAIRGICRVFYTNPNRSETKISRTGPSPPALVPRTPEVFALAGPVAMPVAASLTDRQIADLYMVFGGVPFYWSLLRKGIRPKIPVSWKSRTGRALAARRPVHAFPSPISRGRRAQEPRQLARRRRLAGPFRVERAGLRAALPPPCSADPGGPRRFGRRDRRLCRADSARAGRRAGRSDRPRARPRGRNRQSVRNEILARSVRRDGAIPVGTARESGRLVADVRRPQSHPRHARHGRGTAYSSTMTGAGS